MSDRSGGVDGGTHEDEEEGAAGDVWIGEREVHSPSGAGAVSFEVENPGGCQRNGLGEEESLSEH